MADQDQGAGAIPQRLLGRTGAQVSVLGLGGHHLGDLQTVEEAIRLVHEAVDVGITFFDNCWEYLNGRAEDWLGRAVQGGRPEPRAARPTVAQGDAAVAPSPLAPLPGGEGLIARWSRTATG